MNEPQSHEDLRLAASWLESCENCAHQEGRHVCTKFGFPVKNMALVRCDHWEAYQARKEEK